MWKLEQAIGHLIEVDGMVMVEVGVMEMMVVD